VTWHTVTVPVHELRALRMAIRAKGGTITGCHPGPDGVLVTYVAKHRLTPLSEDSDTNVEED
jgi:hypothetical protein